MSDIFIDITVVEDQVTVEVTDIVDNVDVTVSDDAAEEITIEVTEYVLPDDVVRVPLPLIADYVVKVKSDASGYELAEASGSTELEVVAGEILNGQAVVIQNSLGCFIFDPTNPAHYGKVIGFTKTSAVIGQTVKVLPIGEVVQMGWGLTKGDLYYATLAGQITNIPTTHKIMQPMGVAKDSNTLVINIHQAIITI